MEEIKGKKNAFYIIGLVSGILAIISCFVTIGFSIVNSYYSIYTLALSLIFLGINHLGFCISGFRKPNFLNITITVVILLLSIFVGLTKYGIYFLISSMFAYSLIIIVARVFKILEDRSIQSIVFNVLYMVFAFLFSFVFFFPVIYEKHATSVSNSNFIVLCFSALIIASSAKNILFPYHRRLKLHIIRDVLRKSLVYEIILSLLILVILCSVYFTIVEENMTSYVDSLWYSFSVITTIGFGDVSVKTTFGRILSVILGISGIIVVALFTSVIVNFYNEVNKNRREKKAKEEESKNIEETNNKDLL